MKATLALLAILIPIASSAQVKMAGSDLTSYYLDGSGNTMVEKPLSVIVHADGTAAIRINGPLEAECRLMPGQVKDLINALKKVPDWAAKVKEARIEANKELYQMIEPYQDRPQAIMAVFVAHKDGEEIWTSLFVDDNRNELIKGDVFLSLDQTAALVDALETVSQTHQAILAEKAKADEILK